MNRAVYIFAAILVAWALRGPEGFAQQQELDPLLGDERDAAETEAAPSERTGEPRPAEEPTAATPEASDAPRRALIEEIVVTAERRERQLHDVPISMSVLDSDFMRKQGVTDLQDVARYVPNVRMDMAGTQILPRLRGFGTNTTVTRGFELPVGLVIDEVPYGRQDYFPSRLFDLDRVEVLRGPQGQLFGANTTVGLLNLTTKNPTVELTGFVDAELGELERRRVESGVGGPVVPGLLNFRIAGLWDEQEGHVRNTTASIAPLADELFGGRDRKAARVKLDLPDVFGAGLLLSYQRDTFDFGATPRELTHTRERFRDLVREFEPDADFVPLNYVGSQDHRGFLTADLDIFTAQGRYDLGGWGLN
ncbi:MAG: TonB-dependent receptor plug domain-containing protein, partial [Candidatus Binatia bacterium]